MSIVSRIIAELLVPDDQNNSWYDWVGNQCGHALLGVLITIHFGIKGVLIAGILALLKEALDLLRKHDARAVLDSMQDVSFWIIGAWLITSVDKNLATVFLVMALMCGVIPRARKVFNVPA